MYDSVYIYIIIYMYIYTHVQYDFLSRSFPVQYQNEAQVAKHALKLDLCDNFQIQTAAHVQSSPPPCACKEFEHGRNSDDGNSLEFVSTK